MPFTMFAIGANLNLLYKFATLANLSKSNFSCSAGYSYLNAKGNSSQPKVASAVICISVDVSGCILIEPCM